MTRLCISGTPGTGKSKIAPLLSRKLRWRRLDLNTAIVKQGLYSGYDRVRKSYIADMPKIRRFVQQRTRTGNWIIASHLAHLLPRGLLDIVIVLRCEPKELERRLRQRRWPKEKIAENTEAELIGLIAAEARQRHRAVYELDTTGRPAAKIAADTEKIIKGAGERYRKQIDWLR